MMVSAIFRKFMDKTPMSVMARGLVERILNPQILDKWFEGISNLQYTRQLLFSSIFEMMSMVVCGVHPSIHSAYQSKRDKISVSIKSVYNKLNGMETTTSSALVSYSASEAESLIKELGGGLENPLPGYRIKLLDGNCIEASEHRIKELRGISSGALPGKSLVVLDPVLRIITDVFPCEDGHTQERALLGEVSGSIQANDVWIGDRNFCIRGFIGIIVRKGAFFILRQHGNLPYELIEPKRRFIGETQTGKVYEQLVLVVDEQGKAHTLRRVSVELTKQTRDGDREIHLLTNLPSEEVSALRVAELYRGRWKIETVFQEITTHLNSEINTLGYPKAAIFGFCIALVTYNVLSVMKAAMQKVHGVEVVEKQISGYYIAHEISGTHIGLEIAIPEEEWQAFRTMPTSQVAQLLIELAGLMQLSKYKKHPRGHKKKIQKKKTDKNAPHVSIAKILAKRNR
jgi:hypothetical protein